MNDHISYTQISTYLSCPLKYYFQYVKQIPWPSKPEGLVFGTGIHQALEHFYTGKKEGRDVPLGEMLALYDAAWEKESSENTIQFKNGNTPEILHATAESMLETFKHSVKPGKIIAVEKSFSTKLIDPDTQETLAMPIEGRIDLIEERNGHIHIVDQKTAAKAYTQEKADTDLQLTAYAFVLAREGHDVDDLTLRFDVLMKNGGCSFHSYSATRTMEDLKRFFKITKSVINGIAASAFYPVESWMCNGCVFAEHCKKW